MYLPELAEINNRAKKSIIEWAGLNRKSLIGENEFSSTTNLSSRNYPLISPRPSRETVYTLTSGKALFAATELAWVDSLTFTSPAGDITFGAHTITSATSKFGGIAVGDTLVITGCTVNTDNNTTVIVTTATAAMLTCSGTTFTITSGTPAGKETAAITFTGCSFKYNNVTEGAVTASAKSMVELSGRIVIFPDNASYDTVGDTFAAMHGSVPMSQYGYDAYGVVDTTATTKIHNTTRVTITPSTAYTLTNDKTYTAATAYYFDANSVFISSAAVNFASFTTPSTAYSINFDITGTDITVVVKITNAVYPTQGAIPDIDYACTLNNRIWGVDGDNVYGSALGQYDNWTTLSSPSEATDAYQVDTGTNGDFTGIVSYKGFVLVFKRDRVFKLFGDIPSDFQLVEISRLGCLSNKSICEVNNILFWLSPQGVVAYTGGIPEVIGECLNESYTSGVGGGDGRWYYISLYNGTAYALYTYDTWKGIFLGEDTLNVTEFAFLDGYLYALTSANVISKFNSGTETVSSEAITKEFTEEASNKKGHSELFFRADLQTGATMAVYVRHDNGSFTLVKNYNTTDFTSFKVPLKIKNCDHFQVKLIMTGDYAIHQWQRKFIVGESD